jgi:hypothetical protein
MVGDQHGDAFGMIVLCTDFGLEGPYTGQVKAVLARAAPVVPVVDLFADLPPFRPQAAAYLLAAYGLVFVSGDVIVAVVDPGVGARAPRSRWRRMGAGTWDPTMGYSSSCCGARGWRAAGGSTGSRPRCRQRFMVVICLRRSLPGWRSAKPRQGRRLPRCAIRTGRTTWPRSSTSIGTAMP